MLLGERYLQQAEHLWGQSAGREPAVMCLVLAAERLLNGALVARGGNPGGAGALPELAERVGQAGFQIGFFADSARRLAELQGPSRYGFLDDLYDWDRLAGFRDDVRRLREVLFPRPSASTPDGGVLVCISGPSGVGKTTICRRLVERLGAFLSVSATTRPRRDNEVDGRDYYFISRQEFERRLEAGEFLEYARVYGGQYYGTPAAPVMENLRAGRVVILEIEIEGTIQVARRFPQAVTVYVLAPSAGDQERRLADRATDSDEAIRERLAKADGEIRYAHDCGVYKYFVVNEVLEETVDRLAAIIEKHRSRESMKA